MSRNALRSLLVTCVPLLLAGTAAQAASMYRVRDLGTGLSDLRMNASGAVAATLANTGDFGSRAVLIDPLGQVAMDAFRGRPLHLADDGRVITAPTSYDWHDSNAYGYYTTHTLYSADAANDAGQVVGRGNTYDHRSPDPSGKIGWVYTPGQHLVVDYAAYWERPWPSVDGRMDVYKVTASDAFVAQVYPTSINDKGQVAGAYLRKESVWTGDHWVENWTTRAFVDGKSIGNFEGHTWAQATDINELGHAAGSSGMPYHTTTAFLYRDGQMIDLGQIAISSDYPRTSVHATKALNNLDQVVGAQSFNANWNSDSAHAWLYDPTDARMWNLNDLIPLDSGWMLTSALDINDAGQIIGYGTYNGQSHAYILTPEAVPEPTVLAVFAAGAMGWLVTRAKRPRTSRRSGR